MRIRWRGLELPTEVVRDESVSTKTYGRFTIEPFERGFGTTIGNSLRRVLLSSLEGAAVTKVKIAGADHEFMSLPGVLEDVTDIILNVKSLIVKSEAVEPKTMTISHHTKGSVRAGDFIADPAIEVMDPQHLIATLTDDVLFEMEMEVRTGRGYAPAHENSGNDDIIGVIPVDSTFSPVVRVRYRTEDTRVGHRVNFDRLILEVWTNGTIAPEDAIVEASKILRKHLNPFVQYHELGSTIVESSPSVRMRSPAVNTELEKLLQRPISELDLSVRASNCLESARILTIGELTQKTEGDLLRLRSFGKTSLREIRRKLADRGLSLGLVLENPTDASSAAEPPSSEVSNTGPDGSGAVPGPIDSEVNSSSKEVSVPMDPS